MSEPNATVKPNEIVKEIEQLVRKAVLAEREACARIAHRLLNVDQHGSSTARMIYAAIRERGDS